MKHNIFCESGNRDEAQGRRKTTRGKATRIDPCSISALLALYPTNQISTKASKLVQVLWELYNNYNIAIIF